jgi:hypothetical protein
MGGAVTGEPLILFPLDVLASHISLLGVNLDDVVILVHGEKVQNT